jgi:hypothetical protein
MKFIRIALSIFLMVFAGLAGAAGFFSLILATAISMLADRVYGGSLSHDVVDWGLRISIKRTDADYQASPGLHPPLPDRRRLD